MRAERYITSGKKVPAAARISRVLKVVLFLCIVFFVSRSGGGVFSGVKIGGALIRGERIVVSMAPDPEIQWPAGGHMIRRPGELVYLDTRFKVLHRTNVIEPLRFTANSEGYIMYKKIGKTIEMYDRTGKLLFRRTTRAYPRVSSDKRFSFLVTGDQSGIGILQRNGRLVGELQQIGSMITSYALNSKNDCAYFGLISGLLEKYSIQKRKTVWRRKMAGSKIRFVKGLDVSVDGFSVGVLSGLKPERFSLLDTSGELEWSVQTGGAVRTRVALRVGRRFCAGFTDSSAYLLDRTDGSRLFLSSPVAAEGGPIRFLDFADSRNGKRALLAWGNRKRSYVALFDHQGQVLWLRGYASSYAFVVFSNGGGSYSIQTADGLMLYAGGEM